MTKITYVYKLLTTNVHKSQHWIMSMILIFTVRVPYA